MNNWIDLIFGYKQEGKAAEENLNVYFFLTTEKRTKIESQPDNQLEALINQMFYYGICPKKLFSDPHKPKKQNKEPKRAIERRARSIDQKDYKFIFNCGNDSEHDNELYALSLTGKILNL